MLVKSRRSCSTMSALPTTQAKDYSLLSYRRAAQFLFYSSPVLYFSVSHGPALPSSPDRFMERCVWQDLCLTPLRAARCSCGFVSSARTKGEALQLLQGQHLREPSVNNRAFGGFTQQPRPYGHTMGCSCQEGHSLSQQRPVPGLATPVPMSQALPGTQQKPGC